MPIFLIRTSEAGTRDLQRRKGGSLREQTNFLWKTSTTMKQRMNMFALMERNFGFERKELWFVASFTEGMGLMKRLVKGVS